MLRFQGNNRQPELPDGAVKKNDEPLFSDRLSHVTWRLALCQNIIFVIRGLNPQTVGIKYVNNHLVGWRKVRLLLLETRPGVVTLLSCSRHGDVTLPSREGDELCVEANISMCTANKLFFQAERFVTSLQP